MDHIREELDQLMGKDRNYPLHVRLQMRDHFNDADVCKYNLLGFCPHDLFPNTKHDQGPCQLRHDDFLKEMFDNDPDRQDYAKQYEIDLIDCLQRIVANIDLKIKKSLARAENPVQGNNRIEREQIEQASLLQKKILEDPTSIPQPPDKGQQAKPGEMAEKSNVPELSQIQRNQVFERIEQLEQKIDYFITVAQKQGEEGNIDESEAIMVAVEKLRQEKKELEERLEGKVPVPQDEKPNELGDIEAEKKNTKADLADPGKTATTEGQQKPDRNMKVCEICGALQSVADTDSRLQMHLEGKLHQGYLKIRQKLQELKDKRVEDRRTGNDRISFRRRSRSRDRDKKAFEAALAEEAKNHFYYSSNRWGKGVNMPKLGSINDQSRIKFTELVIARNTENEDQLPQMMDSTTLGREWRYYKKDIDKIKRQKRNEEKAAQLAAEGGRGSQNNQGGNGGFRREDRDGRDKRDGRDGRDGGRPPHYGTSQSNLVKRNQPRR